MNAFVHSCCVYGVGGGVSHYLFNRTKLKQNIFINILTHLL